MESAFQDVEQLKSSPVIPENVDSLNSTFEGCENLITASFEGSPIGVDGTNCFTGATALQSIEVPSNYYFSWKNSLNNFGYTGSPSIVKARDATQYKIPGVYVTENNLIVTNDYEAIPGSCTAYPSDSCKVYHLTDSFVDQFQENTVGLEIEGTFQIGTSPINKSFMLGSISKTLGIDENISFAFWTRDSSVVFGEKSVFTSNGWIFITVDKLGENIEYKAYYSNNKVANSLTFSTAATVPAGTTDYRILVSGKISEFFIDTTPIPTTTIDKILKYKKPFGIGLDPSKNYTILWAEDPEYVISNCFVQKNANGDVHVAGELLVDGEITFENNFSVTGPSEFKDTHIEGTLLVDGETEFSDDLLVKGNATINNNTEVLGNFTTAGTSTFNDKATFADDVDVAKNLKVNGTTNLIGQTTVSSITASGKATFNNDVKVNSDAEFTGDVIINGNIIQNGSSFETHAEEVYSKNALIKLRDEATVALGASEVSGITVLNYDGQNSNCQLVVDRNGIARLGDAGNTQPLATREETPKDTSVLIWDAINNKLITSNTLKVSGTSTTVTGSLSVSGGVTAALTGNATTATKLATARKINGVSFDGSANITVADSTKAPTSHASSAVTYGVSSEANYGHAKASAVAGTANGTASKGTTPTVFAQSNHVHPLQTSVSGNAGTATKLATARTIGGVSFDGSANINLPGVNTTGNQNTTGNASTADKWKTARNITITDADGTNTGVAVSVDGSENETLKLPSTIKANLTGNADTATTATTSLACSGNSATATKLATARKINGVAFDGTSDIMINNTSGNADTAMTAAFASKANMRVSLRHGSSFYKKTWPGLADLHGYNVWTDGENIYYSQTTTQYVLDKASSWIPKTWNGLTDFRGEDVWTDGENIYYSAKGKNYILDKSTSTWVPKTWNGLTSFYGNSVWTDGENIYLSNATNQMVLNKATSTWEPKTWNGLTNAGGKNIWTDGENIYSSYIHSHTTVGTNYVLDKSTSTWTRKTWNGLTAFYGAATWTDGENIYYNSGTDSYVLDKSTSTWVPKTWNGLTDFSGSFWTDGENIYHRSRQGENFVLPATRHIYIDENKYNSLFGTVTRCWCDTLTARFAFGTDGVDLTVQSSIRIGAPESPQNGDMWIEV